MVIADDQVVLFVVSEEVLEDEVLHFDGFLVGQSELVGLSGVLLGGPSVLIAGDLHFYLLVLDPHLVGILLRDELDCADFVADPEEHSIHQGIILRLHPFLLLNLVTGKLN